ncbi:MAG: 2OG-Fe(II) oxygenase [Rhizobium sp.]|nr:2OG-Fe(II) oxygenase [Rhizobium sp.]
MDIPPTLRQWIIDQARQGQPPATVVRAMLAQGWQEEQAVDAVQEVLHGYLVEHAREHGLPEPTAVPEPMERGGPHRLDGGDREVPVLASLLHPRVVVLGSVLSDDECDELVALARQRLARSETFLLEEGVSQVHEGRTSEGMFFLRGENELCRRIEARLAALCQWPVENGEGLQVLRYGPGAEYKPHFDYFDPAKPGTRGILQRGGQRVATVVMYLNTPARGGETTFPEAKFDVAPVKGNAVFFSYDRPHPMTGTLHGGAPVIEGEKWVATKWLRLGAYT